MKKINIFCFGFGQVAKNFIYNLSKKYDVNLAVTSRKKTQKKKIFGINYNSYHFLDNNFSSLSYCSIIFTIEEPMITPSANSDIFFA